jgi:hypothetical protein
MRSQRDRLTRLLTSYRMMAHPLIELTKWNQPKSFGKAEGQRVAVRRENARSIDANCETLN